MGYYIDLKSISIDKYKGRFECRDAMDGKERPVCTALCARLPDSLLSLVVVNKNIGY